MDSLKTVDGIGNYSNTWKHKNLLGNKQWRAFDGIKQ